jgi:hypothetical protein
MATIFGMPIDLPSFAINKVYILLIVAIAIFLICGAIIIFIVYHYRIYRRKIIVFENIAGKGYQLAGKDRAKVVRIGVGGEELLYLRKQRVFRTAYGRKMGKNQYWFAIGQDGYWYNIVLGDLDAKMGMLDIEPIDRDMRYMHVAVARNIIDRYRKTSWADKYLPMIYMAILLLVFLVGMWFLLDKMKDTASIINEGQETHLETMKITKEVLGAVDTIKGGSGIRPADEG